MKSKEKMKDIRKFAFTLIELVVILVIIGILLMVTLYLSMEQIQKMKDKTVKESISSEWLSHYSRNLGSSSFGDIRYKDMDISLTTGENNIMFEYVDEEDKKHENLFTNKFEIKYIKANDNIKDKITITYKPYKINCKIGEEGLNYNSLNLVIRVNDHKDYCFEINNKNCRLFELSESNCETFKQLEGI